MKRNSILFFSLYSFTSLDLQTLNCVVTQIFRYLNIWTREFFWVFLLCYKGIPLWTRFGLWVFLLHFPFINYSVLYKFKLINIKKRPEAPSTVSYNFGLMSIWLITLLHINNYNVQSNELLGLLIQFSRPYKPLTDATRRTTWLFNSLMLRYLLSWLFVPALQSFRGQFTHLHLISIT